MSNPDLTTVELEALFGLLGNESRMRILRALWDEFGFQEYVTATREGTSFGTLRERAGIEDPGNFNYHLGELTGSLVESRDDGYVLTPLGYNVMRAIERLGEFEYASIDPWKTDDPCPFCGAPLVAEYRREVLEVTCEACGALAGSGHFTYVEIPSPGSGELDREDLLDAATVELTAKVRSSLQGFCWQCHSRMDTEVKRCEDHDRNDEGICETCNNRFSATVDASCSACGTSGHGPVVEYAIASPAVAAFYASAGRGPGQIGPWQYRLEALADVKETVRETDPPTVLAEFERDSGRYATRVEASSRGVSIVPEESGIK